MKGVIAGSLAVITVVATIASPLPAEDDILRPLGMGGLSRLSKARTRSISPENFTGEKGKGGMATEGTGATDARDLGRGWKISPSLQIPPGPVPEDAAYFHAQFRRVNPLPYKQAYTILDGVKGWGHYVGTYMAWGVRNNGWWGEGEIKFYLDGDAEFPTVAGTGTEDYFN